jgi:hypothetical protein
MPDGREFGTQPRMFVHLPHVHGAAHHPQPGIAVEIRDRFHGVELDRIPGDPVDGEKIAKDARMLDIEMLEYE